MPTKATNTMANYLGKFSILLGQSLNTAHYMKRKQTCTFFVVSMQLAFLTPCDQAFNPPFLGGKIIELAKFCFKNKRFEPSLSFFSKQVIVSHCV